MLFPSHRKKRKEVSALLSSFTLFSMVQPTKSNCCMPDTLSGFVDSCGSADLLGSEDSPPPQTPCATTFKEISLNAT